MRLYDSEFEFEFGQEYYKDEGMLYYYPTKQSLDIFRLKVGIINFRETWEERHKMKDIDSKREARDFLKTCISLFRKCKSEKSFEYDRALAF